MKLSKHDGRSAYKSANILLHLETYRGQGRAYVLSQNR